MRLRAEENLKASFFYIASLFATKQCRARNSVLIFIMCRMVKNFVWLDHCKFLEYTKPWMNFMHYSYYYAAFLTVLLMILLLLVIWVGIEVYKLKVFLFLVHKFSKFFSAGLHQTTISKKSPSSDRCDF